MLGSGVSSDLVGECCLGDYLEAEVVLEVLAGVADDLEAQTETVAFGLGVAEAEQLAQGFVGDGDDLTGVGSCGLGS